VLKVALATARLNVAMNFRALGTAQFLCLGLALAPLPLRAQEAAACPLPPDIAATFLDAKCIKTTLRMPQTFFRYYSDPKYNQGRYLTTDQFELNTAVIRRLALNQIWGNSAKKMLSVTLPVGTVVYQGIAGPQAPVSCYPGGGQQTYLNIDNIRSQTSFVWVDGPDLAVNPFVCAAQDAATPR
jgi:hypothetical protein